MMFLAWDKANLLNKILSKCSHLLIYLEDNNNSFLSNRFLHKSKNKNKKNQSNYYKVIISIGLFQIYQVYIIQLTTGNSNSRCNNNKWCTSKWWWWINIKLLKWIQWWEECKTTLGKEGCLINSWPECHNSISNLTSFKLHKGSSRWIKCLFNKTKTQ